MPEDEDTKIRRNLVVVSMLILLAVWLRAPLEGLAEALFKVKPVAENFAWRVWLAAGAMLLYFGLRFRFSDENLKSLDPLQAEYYQVEQKIIRRWLARKLDRFVRSGSAGSLDTGGLATVVEAQRREIVENQRATGEAKLSRIRVEAASRSSTTYPPVGSYELKYVEADLSLSFVSNQGLAGTGTRLGFDLPQFSRLQIRCSTLLWLLLYSKSSTQVLVPWLLAVLALGAVSYKVIRTW